MSVLHRIVNQLKEAHDIAERFEPIDPADNSLDSIAASDWRHLGPGDRFQIGRERFKVVDGIVSHYPHYQYTRGEGGSRVRYRKAAENLRNGEIGNVSIDPKYGIVKPLRLLWSGPESEISGIFSLT